MKTIRKNLLGGLLCVIIGVLALALLALMPSMKGVFADGVALDETTATVKITADDEIGFYASFEEVVVEVTANGETNNYASFEEAVNNLPSNASNATVTLLKDATLPAYRGLKCSIDLNGNTLSGGGTTNYNCSLTILDSKGTGKLAGSISFYVSDITVKSAGLIEHLMLTDRSKATISGGKVKKINANGRSHDISGGEIEELVLYDPSKICLSGGTINKFNFVGISENYNMLKNGYAYKSVEMGDIIKPNAMTTSTKVNIIECPHKTQKGEISFTNCVCDYCGIECTHTGNFDSNGKCAVCQYQCSHAQYNESGVCVECGYQCPHTAFTDCVCDVCGFECTHTGHYDSNGKCEVCQYQCSHVQYNASGVCEECAYQCPHTNLDNESICVECHNGIEASVSNESAGTNRRYTSIDDAVAGLTDGDTLTLYKSFVLDSEMTIGVPCTLDLNGYTLSGKHVRFDANTTIVDSKGDGFIPFETNKNGIEVQLRGAESTTFLIVYAESNSVKFYSGRIANVGNSVGTIKNLLPNGYIFVENSIAGTIKTKLKLSDFNNAVCYYKDGYYLTCEECTHTEITEDLKCAYCDCELTMNQAFGILQKELLKAKTELNDAITQKEDVSIVNDKIEQLNSLIFSTEATLNSNIINVTDSQERLSDELKSLIAGAKQSAVDSANTALEQAKTNLQESVNGKLDIAVYNQRVAELSDAIDNAEVASKAYSDSQDASLKADLENKINQAKNAMQTANQTMLERLEKAESDILNNSNDIKSLRQSLTAMIIIVVLFIAISIGGLLFVIFRNRKKQIMIVNSSNKINEK